MSFSSPVPPRPVAPDFSALSLHQIPRPPFIVSMGLRTSASVQQGFHHTNVISSVRPSIAPREQQRGFLDPMARFPGSIPFAQPFSSENALCLRGGKKMNFFPFWSLNPPRSQPLLQLPGRSAMPPREGEPSRAPEAGARARGCALFPAGAHPHFSPPQPPLGRTPSEPVSAAPGPAKPGLPRERGRRQAGGMQVKE